MKAPRRRILVESLVVDSPIGGVGVVLPAVISDRLDSLVVLVEDAGERTSRKELMAALILERSAVGEDLATMLRRYRRAAVRDALVRAHPDAKSILLAARQPGPRRRRRA